MIIAQSKIETASASRYMSQLCKHFAHKISVECDDRTSRLIFAWGICHIAAEEASLTLRCEAADEAGLDRLKIVVGDHLMRFAWRELLTLKWESPQSGDDRA